MQLASSYWHPHTPQVRDADGDLTPLSYEITNGNDLGHFQLNEPTQP